MQHTVGRLRSEVDLYVGVEVDVVERLHLDVGDGRLREPGIVIVTVRVPSE